MNETLMIIEVYLEGTMWYARSDDNTGTDEGVTIGEGFSIPEALENLASQIRAFV